MRLHEEKLVKSGEKRAIRRSHRRWRNQQNVRALRRHRLFCRFMGLARSEIEGVSTRQRCRTPSGENEESLEHCVVLRPQRRCFRPIRQLWQEDEIATKMCPEALTRLPPAGWMPPSNTRRRRVRRCGRRQSPTRSTTDRAACRRRRTPRARWSSSSRRARRSLDRSA